jgi:hypothetical protein
VIYLKIKELVPILRVRSKSERSKKGRCAKTALQVLKNEIFAEGGVRKADSTSLGLKPRKNATISSSVLG